MSIVLDIECVPDQDAIVAGADWLAHAADKRSMTVQQYCQLCPPLVRVYCIGVMPDHTLPAMTMLYDVEYGAGDDHIELAGCAVSTVACASEQGLLMAFQALLSKKSVWTYGTSLITYNGRGYDFLVLWHRLRRYRLQCQAVEAALHERRWDRNNSIDMQDVVTFDGVGQRWPLAAYVLGHQLLFPKGDIDGALLLDALQAGRVDDVLRYNAGDVIATAQLYRHLLEMPKEDTNDGPF